MDTVESYLLDIGYLRDIPKAEVLQLKKKGWVQDLLDNS